MKPFHASEDCCEHVFAASQTLHRIRTSPNKMYFYSSSDTDTEQMTARHKGHVEEVISQTSPVLLSISADMKTPIRDLKDPESTFTREMCENVAVVAVAVEAVVVVGGRRGRLVSGRVGRMGGARFRKRYECTPVETELLAR